MKTFCLHCLFIKAFYAIMLTAKSEHNLNHTETLSSIKTMMMNGAKRYM